MGDYIYIVFYYWVGTGDYINISDPIAAQDMRDAFIHAMEVCLARYSRNP